MRGFIMGGCARTAAVRSSLSVGSRVPEPFSLTHVRRASGTFFCGRTRSVKMYRPVFRYGQCCASGASRRSRSSTFDCSVSAKAGACTLRISSTVRACPLVDRADGTDARTSSAAARRLGAIVGAGAVPSTQNSESSPSSAAERAARRCPTLAVPERRGGRAGSSTVPKCTPSSSNAGAGTSAQRLPKIERMMACRSSSSGAPKAATAPPPRPLRSCSFSARSSSTLRSCKVACTEDPSASPAPTPGCAPVPP
mmetsp:Transcript_1555/g.4392  ORF Transcript_1555/g.4392 Transcript_1555/m.4392 type:complete len:253 (-) Transcript_1555:465-1223(-)